ncbi:hypothetical protein [Effusibacillus consociatus]|uniref:HD domain-containing protein n=1 Tax=Effusibacillus consociatus TaxID=1117041 RepID=A0ABV9Q900_9BACL
MTTLTLRINGTVSSQEVEALLAQARQKLNAGEDVAIQAPFRTPKVRAPFINLAKECGAHTEAIFVHQGIHRDLQIPTYAESLNRIEILQDLQVDRQAAEFFQQNEKELVSDPVKVFRRLEREGALLKFIPEYKGTIGLDQHSPYHTYSVFDHILEATAFVAGTSLKMVWTLLLHDIGKGYPGIKQFLGVIVEPYASYAKKERVVIENGERIRNGLDSGATYRVNGTDIPEQYVKTDLMGHFYDHENVGAQLALKILPRMGYPIELALEVATLIQFHMMMPRNMDTISPTSLKKWYAKVGPYASDLMMVRMADNRGK